MRLVEVSVVAIPLIATAGGLGFGSGGLAVGGSVTGGLLVLGALTVLLLRRRVGTWAYAERDEDLLVLRGVLVRRLSVVPYGRMQFVDVTAGPFERAFRLSTLRMHTAAAASDARIPGLDVTEAERLRDHLATLGEALAAGL